MSPFIVVGIGILAVVLGIAVFRLHPFFALLIAAVLVGCFSPKDLVPPDKSSEGSPQWTLAIEVTAAEFGKLAGSIGIVIAFAAVIGQAMMESGAADKITRRLLALLGEKRANYALVGSGYVLGIPVFFDTVFFLLVPLARALSLRTGRHFVHYVLAICAGGVLTHGLVPPTPGPLVMVSTLEMNLGSAIVGGFLIGLPVAYLAGIVLPRIVTRFTNPPLRDAAGSSLQELETLAKRGEDELPGFVVSILPVVLPVVFITAHTVVDSLRANDPSSELYGQIGVFTSFLGNKIFALGAGTAISLWVLARQKGWSMRKLMESIEPAIAAAGTIILITCAGGAFGKVLTATGLGDEISAFFKDSRGSGIQLLLVAWGIAAVMKIAQGSGTAAMIIGSSVMAGVLQSMTASGVELPFHKIYVFAAIAFGSKSISWMNDSGFWVVCKMSGFTEKETLRTWTVQLAFMSVVGLIEVLILSQVLPFKG